MIKEPIKDHDSFVLSSKSSNELFQKNNVRYRVICNWFVVAFVGIVRSLSRHDKTRQHTFVVARQRTVTNTDQCRVLRQMHRYRTLSHLVVSVCRPPLFAVKFDPCKPHIYFFCTLLLVTLPAVLQASFHSALCVALRGSFVPAHLPSLRCCLVWRRSKMSWF